jgi:hypothetical protein
MAKMTAWLVTIIGLWLVLAQLSWLPLALLAWQDWIIALVVLAIGIGKLMRNYKSPKGRR